MRKHPYNLAPIEELIDYIDSDWLSRIIDNVAFEYSRYVISDPDKCGGDKEAAENLYYMRELRNAISKMMVNDEDQPGATDGNVIAVAEQ